MKTMILAWAIAGWVVGFCSAAAAADLPRGDSPPVIQPADLMTAPPAAETAKSPPNSQAQPAAPSSTNTLHAEIRHIDAAPQSSPTQTNTVAEPADRAALSATASTTSRTTQNGKSTTARKKHGGLIYDVFTTRAAYKLFNPFASIRDEQEDNTVYDPITGKPSGVAIFKIHLGGK